MGNTDNRDILIAQYQYLEREVNYSKQQQMRATSYAFALYGAIISTHYDWFFFPETTRMFFPYIASLLVLACSICFLRSCEKSQKQNNDNAETLRKHICKKFKIDKDIMGLSESQKQNNGCVINLDRLVKSRLKKFLTHPVEALPMRIRQTAWVKNFSVNYDKRIDLCKHVCKMLELCNDKKDASKESSKWVGSIYYLLHFIAWLITIAIIVN